MIIKSNKDLDKVFEFINNNSIIAYDTETTGLNTRKETIIGFGISNSNESFYIAHKEFVGGVLVELVDFDSCVEVLGKLSEKKLLMFNGSFDIRMTIGYFKVNLIESLYSEVMLLKHTVDEDRPFRLKDIAKKLYGDDATAEQKEMKESIKKNGGTETEYYKADLDIMGKYCEKDCMLTFRIFEHYSDVLEKENLYKFFYRDEVMPLYKTVTIPMEIYGVNLDVDNIRIAHDEIVKDISRLVEEIQTELKPMLSDFENWYLWNNFSPKKTPSVFKQYLCSYADIDLPKTKTGKFSITKANLEKLDDSEYKDYLLYDTPLLPEVVKEVQMLMFKDSGEEYMFNLSSKDHLKRLFFDKLEEDPINRTEKGSPQVDDLFLSEMANKYDWAKKLRTLNKLNKIDGTYIGKWLEHQEDGVFYPSWFQHRTTSGRFGGDLMQLPRKLEHGDPLVVKYTNMIRDFVIAKPGYKLVGADYSSLEVVVFADDAGDETLLEMIRNDEDFYSNVAINVHGLSDKYSSDKKADNFLKKHEPELRQNAKSFSLGIRYGLKSYALSKKLDIDERDASLIIEKYFESYPRLKTRMDGLIDFAKRFGYVKSKAGRVRHLPTLKTLAASWGDDLLDNLLLWKKYHDSPKKYSSMKFLAKQYRNMINNCLNFPIQSLAASIVNRSSIALAREFNRKGLDAKIIMNIHDELVVQCKDSDSAAVARIMQFIMENTFKLNVPLCAIPEVGVKYGDIK